MWTQDVHLVNSVHIVVISSVQNWRYMCAELYQNSFMSLAIASDSLPNPSFPKMGL